MKRSAFQIAAVASVLAFGVTLLPFYSSQSGRHFRLFGLHISPGTFGRPLFRLMMAFWLMAVVCLILSLARRERGRAMSAILLAALVSFVVIAVALLGMH
jgi:amino acid transporter